MGIRFFNGRVIRNQQILQEDVWVVDGKITATPQANATEIDIQGHYLAPGYIDLQINGGVGVDFTTHLSGVGQVAKELLKHGVTAFLATLISSPPERYHDQLQNFIPTEGSENGASILGLHMEGPFFNPIQQGAHSLKFIKDSFIGIDLESLYKNLKHIKMVTLAPELPGALEAISHLKQRGIIISAGHTGASEDEFKKGVEAGVSCVTHLFNTMPPFHHRQAGVIGTTLVQPGLQFSLICDGVHLNDQAIAIAYKMNPEGLFLISDSVALWKINRKTLSLGDVEISGDERQVHVAETGRLAGSVMSLDGNVRHLHKVTGCPVPYAIEAATRKPAEVLGIQDTRGSLEPGCQADLIVLDENLYVQATYIKGQCVFKK